LTQEVKIVNLNYLKIKLIIKYVSYLSTKKEKKKQKARLSQKNKKLGRQDGFKKKKVENEKEINCLKP
jgi:hypothetical protein